jgi:hypothetical protein
MPPERGEGPAGQPSLRHLHTFLTGTIDAHDIGCPIACSEFCSTTCPLAATR